MGLFGPASARSAPARPGAAPKHEHASHQQAASGDAHEPHLGPKVLCAKHGVFIVSERGSPTPCLSAWAQNSTSRHGRSNGALSQNQHSGLAPPFPRLLAVALVARYLALLPRPGFGADSPLAGGLPGPTRRPDRRAEKSESKAAPGRARPLAGEARGVFGVHLM